MRAVRWLLCLTLGVGLTGCAASQGFDRHAMQRFLHTETSEVDEPQPDGGRRPPTPFRLGLFFVAKDFPAQRMLRQTDWVAADKERLKGGLASLLKDGLISDIVVLEDPTIRGHDASAIRRAGRRYGADVLLIVEGTGAVDRFNNASAWLYATLVGGYLASGTEIQALTMIQGSLHDVRGEGVYARDTAEGSASVTGPAMLVEDREVLERAKQAALDELSKRMVDQIRRVSRTASNDCSWSTERPRKGSALGESFVRLSMYRAGKATSDASWRIKSPDR